MNHTLPIYGHIGELVSCEVLDIGELFWDAQEQCPYIVTAKWAHRCAIGAKPLMANGEGGVYFFDDHVQRFSIAASARSTPTMRSSPKDFDAIAKRLNQHS